MIWLVDVATATAGGTPMKMSKGVMRKPPPIPNIPARIPPIPPSANSRNMSTGSSAIGK